MNTRTFCRWLAAIALFMSSTGQANDAKSCAPTPSPEVAVDAGHPWRPPFGIDRVGASPVAHIRWNTEQKPAAEYDLVTYRSHHETERYRLHPQQDPSPSQRRHTDTRPYFANVTLQEIPDEVRVLGQCRAAAKAKEILRQAVKWPELEADAEARPDRPIHPVDLGAILVPHDQLLLASGQHAIVDVAVLSRARDIPNARLLASFDHEKSLGQSFPITKGNRRTRTLEVPLTSRADSAVLTVSLTDGSRTLWTKDIRTLVVPKPPRWPTFGAVETRLRYDKSIVTVDPQTGQRKTPIDYGKAWNPALNDVVVFLPNGSRFVFWRGASYIPMWVSPDNTGVSYQWAENLSHPVPHPDGTKDFREPMFDSELRYGRVQIIESTASRVHVRWSYQLTTLDYSVLSDQATEDFYFYLDGFGTRVITLASMPDERYQLTEFIVVTPQDAYPFDVLPSHLADVLYLDGRNDRITFPVRPSNGRSAREPLYVSDEQKQPRVLRLFQHKNDPAAVIYFQPGEITTPNAYASFHDRGEEVTPAYWGSHWPLTRGKWTHWTIDDGIHAGPAHNSVLSVGYDPPKPISMNELEMPDGKGQVRPMVVRRWAALIAKTEASDQELIDWAQSFSTPPSLALKGARLALPSYSVEGRALRLVAEASTIEIRLEPAVRTVNPVFEIENARQQLLGVTLDDKALASSNYAWDGATLWIRVRIDAKGAKLQVRFAERGGS